MSPYFSNVSAIWQPNAARKPTSTACSTTHRSHMLEQPAMLSRQTLQMPIPCSPHDPTIAPYPQAPKPSVTQPRANRASPSPSRGRPPRQRAGPLGGPGASALGASESPRRRPGVHNKQHSPGGEGEGVGRGGWESARPRRKHPSRAGPLPCHHSTPTLRPPATLSPAGTHVHQSPAAARPSRTALVRGG